PKCKFLMSFRTISTRRPLMLIRRCSVLMLIFHQLKNLVDNKIDGLATFSTVGIRFLARLATAFARSAQFVRLKRALDGSPHLSNFKRVAAPIVLLAREDGSIDRKR